MDVVSRCPIRVASMVWQPQPEAWTLTIVCKATFRLEPGVSVLADAQDEPALVDRHWDDDARKSLRLANDVVPFKRRAEVLLVGSAFAPGGRPVRSLVVRVGFAGVDKRVEVWCDRVFSREGQALEGHPFAQAPLRYERAAGGPGTANPVGMSFDATPDAYGAVPIPNLQPPGLHVVRRGDAFHPTGFGPIASIWPARAALLGRHAGAWWQSAWRDKPFPEDVDRSFFNAAPSDQQVEFMRLGDTIRLENLHPKYPELVTRLPGIRPLATIAAGDDVPLTPDTLWIDSDRGLVTMTWRGSVALSHKREDGQVIVSMEEVAIDAAAGRSDDTALDRDDDTTTQRIHKKNDPPTMTAARIDLPVMPFKPAPSPWVGYRPAKSADPAREDSGTVMGGRASARDVLPAAWNAPVGRMEPAPIRQAAENPPPTPPAAEPTLTLDGETADTVTGVGPADSPSESAAAAPAADPAGAPTAAADEAPPDEALPLAQFPIERCAKIAASIAQRPADKAEILESADLRANVWTGLESHWSKAVAEETTRGKMGLLQTYDAAYVAGLEAERGPIEVDDYARLVVAAERGKVADVLAELTLPRTAWVRIERVWLRKIVGDAKIGKSVSRAAKAMREG